MANDSQEPINRHGTDLPSVDTKLQPPIVILKQPRPIMPILLQLDMQFMISVRVRHYGRSPGAHCKALSIFLSSPRPHPRTPSRTIYPLTSSTTHDNASFNGPEATGTVISSFAGSSCLCRATKCMSWQQRGTKRYFYRNVWQDGRSVRTYLGTGDAAELAATADALRRVQREIDARKWQQEQERRAAAEALLNEVCK